MLRIREGGGHHDFPSKICCLSVPKKFVEEPFCVSENFWYRKILWIRGGGGEEYQDFPSHRAKKFCRATRQCFTNLGYRKICIRGVCHDFPSKICCLTVPKHFIEEPFCALFQQISGSKKKLWIRGGGGGGGKEYQDSQSKIFCLTVPKAFVGEHFSVSLISSIEKC